MANTFAVMPGAAQATPPRQHAGSSLQSGFEQDTEQADACG
ncbi:hypothetical protein C4K02_2150 [Pseudomonas synxantha]|nr:hypothetical protein C4K02_2150 [Pseudomonas synxantha]